MAVRTILFDFGGCIDAPGIHTRTLFWRAFTRAGLMEESQRAIFQEAYTLADQRMMASGEAKALALRPFNLLNSELIAEKLGLSVESSRGAGDWVTDQMAGYIAAARPALVELSERMPIGIISNFTGNLEVILEEYSLRKYFSSVTESFYVGCSKPDPRIFHAALAKQSVPAGDCVYVGDNPVNDIAPAKALGLKTVLIFEKDKRDCGADLYIRTLQELPSQIAKL